MRRRKPSVWRQVATAVLAATFAGAAAAQSPPLAIARQGYFFVGGQYFDAPDGQFMSGQMYVQFQIPANQTRPTPIVMFSGGGQSGLNYAGTPDGREGWMEYFARQGYAVYVLDQPSRARSPHQPEIGQQSRNARAGETLAAGAASHAVAGIRRGW
jgi:pimeloyl-ACP methyl ester carboxylesterase